jgi:hypothetical protein
MGTYQIKASNGGVYEVDAPNDEKAASLEKFINERIAAGDPDLKGAAPPPDTLVHDPQPLAAPAAPAGEEATPASREPIGSSLEAGVIGAGDFLTGGLLDEIHAGLTTALPGRDSYWSAPEGRSFRDQYDLNLQQSDGVKQAAFADHPIAATVGQVGGLALGGAAAGSLGATIRGAQIATGVPNALKTAVATDALVGAAYGAGNSNDNRVKGALEGAATNALGGVIGRGVVRGVGNVLAPVVAPAVRRLSQAGVSMTPGQMFGQNGVIGGTLKSVEDRAAGLPIIGDAIQSARRAGVEDLNRAAVSKALEPIAEEVPPNTPPGRSLIDWAQSKLDEAYDKGLSGISLTPDADFQTGMQNISGQIGNLTSDQADEVTSVMKRALGPFGSDPINGSQLQAIKRGLNDKIYAYRRSPEPRNHDIADTLETVRDEFMGLASRQAPDNATMFRAADSAYANLTAIERAAAKSKADGVFTPENLAQGVREADRSTRKRAFAAGKARLQDLSDDAKTVLPSSVPDSGTAGRLALYAAGGGVLGAGGGYASGQDNTTNVLAGLALAAPFTPIGRRAVQAALIDRPEMLLRAGEAVRQRDALGGLVGSGIALSYGR